MKWMLVTSALFSSLSMADDRAFETPEVRCLNDHTIPFIKSDIPARKVVDNAYIQCKPELNKWMSLQESLPDEMRQKMRKELYEFYIHMIERRRQSEAKHTATTAL